MKWIACALLTLSLLGALPARSSAEGKLVILPPEDIASRFYTNPSNLFDIGDPHILPAGGKYYTFATGGTVGYNVWESDDLRTWGNKQKALRKVIYVKYQVKDQDLFDKAFGYIRQYY